MQQSSRSVPEAISVLVSDGTRMGGQLLTDALRRSSAHFLACACAVNSREVLKALEEHEPQIALVSLNLEDGLLAGLAVLRDVHTLFPKTRPILMVEASEPVMVINAFRAGAKGIFCRTGSFEALCKCISAVHKGQIWATSDELQSVLEVLARAAPLQRFNGSRVRLTNREVSKKLNLSAHTVKNYLFRIFDKLGISSRVELVIYALDQKESRPTSQP